jgi:hypothetical protein
MSKPLATIKSKPRIWARRSWRRRSLLKALLKGLAEQLKQALQAKERFVE